MPIPLNVLILEDQLSDVELMLYELRRAGFEVNWRCVNTEVDYLTHLGPDLDMILSDYQMPQFEAPYALELLQKRGLDIPFIIITGTISEEVVVACMKQGATDYLLKDRLTRLGEAVKHALQQRQLHLEKRQAELALRASEEKFRTIFREVLDMILIVDPDTGQILSANPATEHILGYQADWLIGQPCSVFRPTGLATLCEDLLARLATQGPIFEFQELLRADGSICFMDLTATLIPWSDKQVMLITLRDVSERKRTEKALRESEELFRQVISSISDHIYVTEITQAGRYINRYLSPHIEGLTGYAYQKFIDDWSFWPSQVIHPEDRATAALQKQKLARGQRSTVEYRLVQANGDIIWVRDSARVGREGSSKIIYGVVSDVTERKQAELALTEERTQLARRVDERTTELQAANAELARAARLKDEFLAMMSHELRTPLSAILGMSEILRENVYGPLNEAQLEALRHVEEGGRHLLELINDILDLSKIEAGKMELTVGPTSVTSVCRSSLRFIQQMAHKKRLKVFSVLDPQVDIIQADERRLKQILVNLLTNAVKFTPEEGQIGLEVIGDTVNQALHFTVWDTGIGIAAEEVDRLFKPFVQIDSSLSRRHEGTGLGLSLVSRLVEMHGGGVSVQSKLNEGSRFTVSFPWQVIDSWTDGLEQQGDRMLSPSAFTGHSPFLILLVEDNEINIIAIRDALQAKGYRVIVARNGLEAIELAEQVRPHLILMDVHLPQMDGLEATRRIRARKSLTKIPIIALTALAMPGDRERCLAAGMSDYLSKPVSLKLLNEAIQKQMQPYGG